MKQFFTEEELEKIIAKEIVWSIKRYNEKGFDENNICRTTELLHIFPSKPSYHKGEYHFHDTQANACGVALIQAFKMIRLETGLDEKIGIGYEPREEFERFKTVQDVMQHFKEVVVTAKGEGFLVHK